MSNDYALESVQSEVAAMENQIVSGDQKLSVNQILSKITSKPIYSPSTIIRRGLFCWLKIFVHDYKRDEIVNVRIPLPIPLIGLLFRRTMSTKHSLGVMSILEKRGISSTGTWKDVSSYLDSIAGVDLIRVESKKEKVVIGLE